MFGATGNEEDDRKEEQKREELISMHTTLSLTDVDDAQDFTSV